MIRVSVMVAGSKNENCDYAWYPEYPSADISAAVACLTSADRENSLVAWRDDSGSCSVLVAKIPTGCVDFCGREISCKILVECLQEVEVRALVIWYLDARGLFVRCAQKSLCLSKDRPEVDVSHLKADIRREIDKYISFLDRGPVHSLGAGAYRNTMKDDVQWCESCKGLQVRHSLSSGPGVKIVLSDFGRDGEVHADLLLTASELPAERLSKPRELPIGLREKLKVNADKFVSDLKKKANVEIGDFLSKSRDWLRKHTPREGR